MVALPSGHPAARRKEVDLASLKDDSFVLFARQLGSGLYDAIVNACRRAGFEPVTGQFAPQITSVVDLVAAELGVSIVPASMSQLRVGGVAYRQIAGKAPTARLALAHRRGETSPIVGNFVARAVS